MSTASTESELLERARAGDRMALGDLLERYAAGLRRELQDGIPRRLRALLSVEDVLQQTFTDAFLGIGGFSTGGSGTFSGWLSRMANRNLLDALRMLRAQKRGGAHTPATTADHDDSDVALLDLLSGHVSTPSRHAARQEARNTLHQALRNLPTAYRQVIQMYDLDGRPIDDVAESMDRSVGAVYMLRARAHDRLQQMMGPASLYFSKKE